MSTCIRRTQEIVFLGIIGVLLSQGTINAGPRVPGTSESNVIRLLLAPPIEWPHTFVHPFVEAMPERVLRNIADQTASTARVYLARGSSHPLHPKSYRADFFVATGKTGGSYIAMFRHLNTGLELIWDTLMPPSIIYPTLEFVDVDGDPVYEAICSGQIFENGLTEWVVIDWDSAGAHLLAPRLDQPGTHVMANRLIGRQLRLVDDSTTSVKRIEIIDAVPTGVPTAEAGKAATGIRVFRYDPDVGGYLPID